MTETFQHISVLLNESIDGLAIKPDGIYIDGTFGRGGHSRTILSKLGRMVVYTVSTVTHRLSQKRAKSTTLVLPSFMVHFLVWRSTQKNTV